MKRVVAEVQLVAASLGLPGRAPGAARADNSPFGDLLTTINTLGPEVAALQALAPSCTPTDPCVPAGSITLVNAGTLAGFNQRSLDNAALHNATSILALRGALGALNVPLSFCGDLACSESLTTYLAAHGVDPATVVAAVGIPPNPIRIYFQPADPRRAATYGRGLQGLSAGTGKACWSATALGEGADGRSPVGAGRPRPSSCPLSDRAGIPAGGGDALAP